MERQEKNMKKKKKKSLVENSLAQQRSIYETKKEKRQ